MPTLTDEQLLEKSFFVEDPMVLEGVVHELPPTSEIPEIDIAYDTRLTTGQLVPCVHCGFPNHHKGFVMRFADGTAVLVGNVCGKKLYGADFTATEKRFDTARIRAIYLKRRKATLAVADRFRERLSDLCSHPSLNLFVDAKRQLHEMRELSSSIGKACQADGGNLYVDDQVRDIEAEAHREEIDEIRSEQTGKPPPRRGPIFKTVPKLLGTISGQGFWRVDDSPKTKIARLAEVLSVALNMLREEEMTVLQFGRFFKQLSENLDELAKEIGRLCDLNNAFELNNLTLVAEWASRRGKGRSIYRAEVGLLRWKPSDGEPVTLSWPTGYKPPPSDWVEEFRSATS